MVPTATDVAVPGLVRRHQVRFEVRPDEEIAPDGRRVRVGFQVDLWAVNERLEIPDGEESRRAYADLRAIAASSVPGDTADTRFEIEPFDAALYPAPEGHGREEVRLEVRILHRHETFAPIDRGEEVCLAEFRRRLVELGVKEGARPR